MDRVRSADAVLQVAVVGVEGEEVGGGVAVWERVGWEGEVEGAEGRLGGVTTRSLRVRHEEDSAGSIFVLEDASFKLCGPVRSCNF